MPGNKTQKKEPCICSHSLIRKQGFQTKPVWWHYFFSLKTQQATYSINCPYRGCQCNSPRPQQANQKETKIKKLVLLPESNEQKLLGIPFAQLSPKLSQGTLKKRS